MTQIAVSTQLWGEELLGEKQLRLAAESGFRALELFAAPGHFEWQDEAYVNKIAGLLRALGLRVYSLHAPWAPGQDIAALDKTQRQTSIESVKRAVDDLALVQGQVLVLHPGATLNHPERKIELLRISRDSIATIADYAAARGCKIALENPPPYELGGDNRDLMVLYRYFANDPTIQACFDTGHGQLSAQGLAFVSIVPKDILLVHISDNGGRQDDHWMPSPKGTVPWSELFGLLRARRFDACLMLELTDLPGKEQLLADGWTWMNNALRAIS
jgi:sugar phosphate isomerase/epimerase